MSGEREQKPAGGRAFSTWQSREVGQVNFLFGLLALLYPFPPLVKAPLTILIMTSHCLLTLSPAALVSLWSLSLLLFGCSFSLPIHPDVFFSPVLVPHEGRQRTLQPALAAVQDTSSWDSPNTIYVSSEKLLSSLPSFQAAQVHSLVQGRGKGRGGVENGPFQDVSWSGKTLKVERGGWVSGFTSIHTHLLNTKSPNPHSSPSRSPSYVRSSCLVVLGEEASKIHTAHNKELGTLSDNSLLTCILS